MSGLRENGLRENGLWKRELRESSHEGVPAIEVRDLLLYVYGLERAGAHAC